MDICHGSWVMPSCQHPPAEPEVWPQLKYEHSRQPPNTSYSTSQLFITCVKMYSRGQTSAHSAVLLADLVSTVSSYITVMTLKSSDIRNWPPSNIFFKFIMKRRHLLPCLPSLLRRPEIWAAHVQWITTQMELGIAPFSRCPLRLTWSAQTNGRMIASGVKPQLLAVPVSVTYLVCMWLHSEPQR